MIREAALNVLIQDPTITAGIISDGCHTFDELYDHRITLFIALCKTLHANKSVHEIWRTIKHSDNTIMKGWFIMGINKEAGNQITYHLPIDCWDECKFAETLDKAPDYDNHTSNDVVLRLKTITHVNNPV